MELSINPNKYSMRILPEVIIGGSITVFFFTIFVLGLVYSMNLGFILTTGLLFFWLLYINVTRIKWYSIFITRVNISDDVLMVEYLERDKSKPKLEFSLNNTKISFSRKGWGGAVVLMTISNENHRITQISTGNWTTNRFMNILKKFKTAKGEKLTYDEQDLVKKWGERSD